ncbi:hypothetical protein [Corynebacterium glucuronolyticum]|uniref:hypothetical protein n=1 Tax=Corynebacterium glucuronolyticum TaxID=39791 RepID=UPI00019C20C9|nr:hypothetical protein [Corynebacterium glucuronolyticum]EEI26246.1 hypothetical protein HMPREF0294_2284 [Corynebacterium glucuronolyticum ATCC 51867]
MPATESLYLLFTVTREAQKSAAATQGGCGGHKEGIQQAEYEAKHAGHVPSTLGTL